MKSNSALAQDQRYLFINDTLRHAGSIHCTDENIETSIEAMNRDLDFLLQQSTQSWEAPPPKRSHPPVVETQSGQPDVEKGAPRATDAHGVVSAPVQNGWKRHVRTDRDGPWNGLGGYIATARRHHNRGSGQRDSTIEDLGKTMTSGKERK